MEKADPIGERQPRAAHGLILARKVSGRSSVPKRNSVPHCKTLRAQGGCRATARFWSACAPAPLSRVPEVIGRLGAPEDLGFPRMAFLGKDEEHDGAGPGATKAFLQNKANVLRLKHVF